MYEKGKKRKKKDQKRKEKMKRYRSVVVTSFSAADALKVLRSITTELLEANVVPLAFCADNAKSMQNALKEAALPVSMYLKKQTLPAAQHFTN